MALILRLLSKAAISCDPKEIHVITQLDASSRDSVRLLSPINADLRFFEFEETPGRRPLLTVGAYATCNFSYCVEKAARIAENSDYVALILPYMFSPECKTSVYGALKLAEEPWRLVCSEYCCFPVGSGNLPSIILVWTRK